MMKEQQLNDRLEAASAATPTSSQDSSASSAPPPSPGQTPAGSAKHWSKMAEHRDMKESPGLKKLAAMRSVSGAKFWQRTVDAFDKEPGVIYSTASPHYRKCIFRFGFPQKGDICRNNGANCPRCRAKADFDRGIPIPK